MLARPVKLEDTDLLLLGSVHPVPMDDCFWRWQSMARRVSNSLVQWAHLKPRARGAFLYLFCHEHRQSCMMPASATELCLSHGKCETLLQNRPHVSVDMTTWKGIQHTILNILCNNKKDCTLAQWPHEKCQEMQEKYLNYFEHAGRKPPTIVCLVHAAKTKKPLLTVWPAMWYA